LLSLRGALGGQPARPETTPRTQWERRRPAPLPRPAATEMSSRRPCGGEVHLGDGRAGGSCAVGPPKSQAPQFERSGDRSVPPGLAAKHWGCAAASGFGPGIGIDVFPLAGAGPAA